MKFNYIFLRSCNKLSCVIVSKCHKLHWCVWKTIPVKDRNGGGAGVTLCKLAHIDNNW